MVKRIAIAPQIALWLLLMACSESSNSQKTEAGDAEAKTVATTIEQTPAKDADSSASQAPPSLDELLPETLSRLIALQNGVESAKFVDTLSPPETARAVSRLTEAEQARLFSLLSPEDAADLIEDIPEAQAADLVEDMPSAQAAAIMEALASDHLVDVLGEMEADASQAVLAKMDRKEAEEARMLLAYIPDCAGGLMIS